MQIVSPDPQQLKEIVVILCLLYLNRKPQYYEIIWNRCVLVTPKSVYLRELLDYLDIEIFIYKNP